MKKKLLAAVLLTATMILTNVFSVFAAETVDCTGWWAAHSSSIEVTEAGGKVTFPSVTYADAVNNWDSPIVVLYSADSTFAGGAGISDTAGYYEYYVVRSDSYGWTSANATPAGTNTNDTPSIFTEKSAAEGALDNFLANNKAGVDVTVTAKLEGSNAIITVENNGVKTTSSIGVDASKPLYISLGGEHCTLTNINVTSLAPETGDSNVIAYAAIAMLLSAALGVAVFASRKKVTE